MVESQDQSVEQNYEQLKKIGAQKIHEQTHIPKVQCEDLVNGYFESMTKIQFIGFISILEREYSIDLSATKEEGLKYFSQQEETPRLEESKVFVTPKKVASYSIFYIFAAIIVFIAVFIGIDSEDKKVEPKIDSKKIKLVASKIEPKKETEVIETTKIIEDESIKEQVIKEQEKEEIIKEVEETNLNSKFQIIPNIRLWIGYINLVTGKKEQMILKKLEKLELDADANWLLSLGHGDVSFDVNGELDKYKIPKNIRFLYKDGELKKITYKEFLSLNEGKGW
jgi:hypothetical protein